MNEKNQLQIELSAEVAVNSVLFRFHLQDIRLQTDL